MALGGIDLGATNLRAAVTDGDGEPVAIERRPTPNGPDGRTVVEAVTDTLEVAATAAGVVPSDLGAVGVGTIGPLDRNDGMVVHPPNLGEVAQIPLRDGLADHLGHDRIFVENDAIAGLVGELIAVEDSPENLVYLTMSTGIGAGVAVDGHVLLGRGGNAAEIGHIVVDPDGARTCGCGRPGHWEAYCGGAAIPGLARDLAASVPETTLEVADPDLTAADVFAAAGDDPLADRVIERVRAYNAIGVSGIVHAYAPDRVAIGGAVALENPSLVIDPLPRAIEAYTMLPLPEIRPAAHGRSAVLRGALALASQGGIGG